MRILMALLTLFWSVGRYCDLSFLAVAPDSPWWTCLTYSFVHKNILHLLLNIWAISVFYKPLRHFKPHALAIAVFFVPFAAAVTCRLGVSFYTTIGASAIAFGLMGCFIAEYDIIRKGRVYSSVAISLLVPFLFPNVNAWCHLFAFVYGFAYGKLYHGLWLLNRKRKC